MIRHWTVSIDGGASVHLDLAQYAAAIERAKQEGKPARVMVEANPTIEMTLPTGSKAENPPGRQGRLSYHVAARRDPEAGDGAVRPAAEQIRRTELGFHRRVVRLAGRAIR